MTSMASRRHPLADHLQVRKSQPQNRVGPTSASYLARWSCDQRSAAAIAARSRLSQHPLTEHSLAAKAVVLIVPPNCAGEITWPAMGPC